MGVGVLVGKYKYVGIPEAIHDEISKIVAFKQFGYRTVSEFVIDATRRRLETLLTKLNTVPLELEVPTVE